MDASYAYNNLITRYDWAFANYTQWYRNGYIYPDQSLLAYNAVHCGYSAQSDLPKLPGSDSFITLRDFIPMRWVRPASVTFVPFRQIAFAPLLHLAHLPAGQRSRVGREYLIFVMRLILTQSPASKRLSYGEPCSRRRKPCAADDMLPDGQLAQESIP